MPIIRAASLAVVPWRNGLGTSRTIAGAEQDDGSLAWQVGIADLAGDAPFSDYTDIDRIFTPIEGNPAPALAFDGGPFEPCPLLVPKPFAGERRTLMRMPAPGRAFNLLVNRRLFRGSVTVHRLAPDASIPPVSAAITLVHCLSGALFDHPASARLEPGDSLVGTDPLTAGQAGATVLLVQIEPI